VANALDDSITVLDITQGASSVKTLVPRGGRSAAEFTVAGTIDLGGPDEITEIRWGERLFHSADNAFGDQFSCRSCHPDGHINGLTTDIEADGVGLQPVDNRTLRGIYDTPPFKWEGTNPSLARQCGPRLAVFFTRLEPFSPEELAALVRYEVTLERPPNRYREPEGLTLQQRRGKAVFERTHANDGQPLAPELRCTTCHYTPYRFAPPYESPPNHRQAAASPSREQMETDPTPTGGKAGPTGVSHRLSSSGSAHQFSKDPGQDREEEGPAVFDVGTTLWFDSPVDMEIDDI
jgi:hypothetical protein